MSNSNRLDVVWWDGWFVFDGTNFPYIIARHPSFEEMEIHVTELGKVNFTREDVRVYAESQLGLDEHKPVLNELRD